MYIYIHFCFSQNIILALTLYYTHIQTYTYTSIFCQICDRLKRIVALPLQ